MLETSLAQLESVSTARVVADEQRRIRTVDVRATPGWPLDTVRRDVQALLHQRFGLEVPATAIRIERVDAAEDAARPTDDATTPAPAQPGRTRLMLDAVHLALRAQGTSVAVDLLDGEQRLRGTTGPVGATSVLVGVVQATLDALRHHVEHRIDPVVAEVVEAGGDRIAIATVVASDGRSQQRLTGSALVRGNVEDAMARATLDATNRLVTD